MAGVGLLGQRDPIRDTARAQDGSPSPVPPADNAAGGLSAMLPHVPASLLAPASGVAYWTYAIYADVASQLAALGIPAPRRDDTAGHRRWWFALSGFALPIHTSTTIHPSWHDVFGWTMHEVDQSLEYVDAGERVMILRGNFDFDLIRSSLERSRYRPIAIDGGTIYSLFPDRHIDWGNQASHLMTGDLNNLALMDNGTLVGTGPLNALEQALSVGQDAAPSLAADEGTAMLLSAVEEPLATAVVIPGTALDYIGLTPDGKVVENPNVPSQFASRIAEMAEATDASLEMPPIKLVLMGMTAGGPPSHFLSSGSAATPTVDSPAATIWAYVLFKSSEDAELAVLVLRERLAALRIMPPWLDFTGFEREIVRTAPGQPVVILSLGGGIARFRWQVMLLTGALPLFAW
jgi:hypothetical protein